EGSWLMFSRAKIISTAFERPWCAERNVGKSAFGSGIVNFPLTLNCGIKRIKPSGLHNNSDCADKAAAPEDDEADTATARTTALIYITESLRMSVRIARIFALPPRFGKPGSAGLVASPARPGRDAKGTFHPQRGRVSFSLGTTHEATGFCQSA